MAEAAATSPKATKKRGTKKSSKSNSYIALVKEAILAVGKPVRGASRQAIRNYIAEKHAKTLGSGWENRLRAALRKFAKSKKLVQTKGSFRISKAEKKAKKPKKAKKVKKAKKPKKAKKARKSVKKGSKKAGKKSGKKGSRKSSKKAAAAAPAAAPAA
jgi:hypothetical protein